MKILVTGGTGFLGSYVANHLYDNGHDVTICDNNFRGKIDDFVSHLDFIKCDLTDKDEFKKLDTDYDCIYHFAAINGTGYFYEIPHLVLKVNTLININILDWCVENNIRKILSTSSSEVYASTKDVKIPTDENVQVSVDDIYNPRFSYAGSKIFGELLFLNYHTKYNLDVRIVRPHNIYGPRMGFKHVIPQVIERIYKKEEPFKIYGYDQSRSFCFIDDAVNAMELVMDTTECSGKVLNIGSGIETNIKELIRSLFDISDYHPEIDLVDAPQGSVDRRCPDISLLSDLTDYKPLVNLHQGLEKSYDWYMEHYKQKYSTMLSVVQNFICTQDVRLKLCSENIPRYGKVFEEFEFFINFNDTVNLDVIENLFVKNIKKLNFYNNLEKQWAEVTLALLEEVKTPYVLYQTEDQMINFDVDDLHNFLDELESLDIDFVNLCKIEKYSKSRIYGYTEQKYGYSYFGKNSPTTRLSIDCVVKTEFWKERMKEFITDKHNCPHKIPYPHENVPNYFEGYYDYKKGIRRFKDLKCYIPKLTMFEQDLSDGVNMEKLSSVKSRKKKNK